MSIVLPQQSFFDLTGRATPALLALLRLMEVEHDGHLSTIQPATQAWYEKGKFRAEITEKHGHKKADALPILTQLGLIQEVNAPTRGPYHGALLMGATVVAVRKRMAHLLRDVESGVWPGTLFLLGSTRKLLPDKEKPEILHTANPLLPFQPEYVPSDAPVTNEAQIMELVWRQSWPKQFDAMKQVVAENERATTLDTLTAWKEQCKPKPGGYLVASSQPDVAYQTYLAGRLFGEGYVFHGIGPTANLELPFSMFLHSVAVMINVIHEDWMKR